MDSRISESDVVYTFLHCLLRDEQELMRMREGVLPPRALVISNHFSFP